MFDLGKPMIFEEAEIPCEVFRKKMFRENVKKILSKECSSSVFPDKVFLNWFANLDG